MTTGTHADTNAQGTPPAGTEPETNDAKQRAAYSAATKRLREANREAFNNLMKEEAKARGLDWSPRPTKEEKARAELQRILAENPSLAAEVAGTSV